MSSIRILTIAFFMLFMRAARMEAQSMEAQADDFLRNMLFIS